MRINKWHRQTGGAFHCAKRSGNSGSERRVRVEFFLQKVIHHRTWFFLAQVGPVQPIITASKSNLNAVRSKFLLIDECGSNIIFFGYLHSSLLDRSSIIGEHPSYACFLLSQLYFSLLYLLHLFLVFYLVQATNLQFYCFAHYITCDYDFASRKQTQELQLTAQDHRWLLFKHLNVLPLSFFLLRSWRNLFLDTVRVSTLSADVSSERKT